MEKKHWKSYLEVEIVKQKIYMPCDQHEFNISTIAKILCR